MFCQDTPPLHTFPLSMGLGGEFCQDIHTDTHFIVGLVVCWVRRLLHRQPLQHGPECWLLSNKVCPHHVILTRLWRDLSKTVQVPGGWLLHKCHLTLCLHLSWGNCLHSIFSPCSQCRMAYWQLFDGTWDHTPRGKSTSSRVGQHAASLSHGPYFQTGYT